MANMELHNPYSGALVYARPAETFEAVDARIGRARETARAWSRLTPVQRAQRLGQALDYFRERRQQIARQVSQEVGKPLAEAAAEVDYMVDRAEWLCRFAADGALSPLDLRAYDTADFQGRVEYVGKGVVYIIAPWNYPLFCAINGTVCALLSGSAVILKHTTAPSVGEHFERAFGSLGGQEGLLSHVVVDYGVSGRIIEQADIDHVVFTGSVASGRVIQASIARRAERDLPRPFIGASLELGSNDAAYIAADADLDHALEWTVRIGRLHNAGQSCCAVKRVFVHQDLYERYVAGAAAIMDAVVQGDPAREDVTMGPLFGGEAAVRRLQGMVDDAVARGARVTAGGQSRRIGPALFMAPTLLADARPDMQVMREETFGPVLPVMRVASDDEAIVHVNDSRYGLSASIFTRDRERAEHFIAAMDSGTVYVNRCNFVDARLGWIGHKHSGNGSISLSPAGLRAMSQLRSVNIDPRQLS